MSAPPSDECFVARFGEWSLRQQPLELTRAGVPVRVQELPLRVLAALVARPGQLVTRETLISRLWPRGVVDFEAGLNTAVRKLRAALGDDALEPRFIVTVPRQGYRFIAELERAPAGFQAHDLWLRGKLQWQAGARVLGYAAEHLRRIEAFHSRALELDPQFAPAVVDRAAIRHYLFLSGNDVTPDNVDGARSDVSRARRLLGEHAAVLAREAAVAGHVDHDPERALSLLLRAEALGPTGADVPMMKGVFLSGAGRFDEALRAFEAAAEKEPDDVVIAGLRLGALFAARRPADALQVWAGFDQRYPGRLTRGELTFAFTADTRRWRQEIDVLHRAAPADALSMRAELLRYEGRFDELGALLRAAGQGTFRQHLTIATIPALPARPVAELTGWHALLTGERSPLADAADALQRFVDGVEGPWNSWWRLLLEAQAWTFRQQHERAARTARAALGASRRLGNAAAMLFASTLTARVLAWSGAGDEAIDLLERLSSDAPALGPAAIARDPLLALPLAKHARHARLRERLETEIAGNRRLLERDLEH